MKIAGKPERRQAILFAVLFFPLTLSLTDCQTNPATGRSQIMLMSLEQEIQIGRESDEQIVQLMGLYENEPLQQYVMNLGQSIAATSELPDLPWTFRVIDDETVNAFALPGGFIYVTRGILAHFNNEAELIGVLGHEIGHVTARHSANRLSKAQLTQVGLGLAVVLQPGLAGFAPLASLGAQLMFLKFGRQDEYEADELGVRYMANVNRNPEELISVMETLNQVSQQRGAGRIPEWLSTHPHPENRQERILSAIENLDGDLLGAGDFESPEREEYLRRLQGIVYGPDPREGFTVDRVFYHPNLRFRMDVPPDWQIINQKQAVIAISPNQDAAIQLTLSDAGSIREAAARLYEDEAVTGQGARNTTINGLSAATGTFQVQTEQGVLEGRATFISYGGEIYQIIGYSTRQQWSQFAAPVRQTMESFVELRERSMLEVEPLRLNLVQVDRQMTLQQFYDQQNPPVPLVDIALINQMQADSTIPAGMLVKTVTGRRFGE